MSDPHDLMFLAAAERGEVAITSDGYRWNGEPVDPAAAPRITALLDAGLLLEKSPSMDFTLLEPTVAGRALLEHHADSTGLDQALDGLLTKYGIPSKEQS